MHTRCTLKGNIESTVSAVHERKGRLTTVYVCLRVGSSGPGVPVGPCSS